MIERPFGTIAYVAGKAMIAAGVGAILFDIISSGPFFTWPLKGPWYIAGIALVMLGIAILRFSRNG
ncbi:MAG: hypothetical protein EXS05_20510 [Planctomycetaceae bacterium]|nr:hypothetical protein [Planctomycetaceae bacterium]